MPNLLLTGHVVPGQDPAVVAEKLAKVLKLDAHKAAALLDGQARVIKKNLSADEAFPYLKALEKTGAQARLRNAAEAETDTTGQSEADNPTQGDRDTHSDGLSLCPVQTPVLAAEERPKINPVIADVSAYSVDDSGSNILPPKPPVKPAVSAPDLPLDPPGTTILPDRPPPPPPPDVSAFSLAED